MSFLVLASVSAQAQTQADLLKIDPATQQARDGDRGYILEQERQAEIAALAAAEKRLASGAPGEQQGKLAVDVERHKKNLAALDAEISRLRGSGVALPAGPVRLKAASAARPGPQTQTTQTAEVPFWDVYRREKLK